MDKANNASLNNSENGYYHLLRNAIKNKKFEVTSIATTNYNNFIEKILESKISYLNGSTEMWYDPYINRMATQKELTTDEKHILVPLMFTQSGTKPMTSIAMSERYVETYHKWKSSDALVVVGFGFGSDDEHINDIIRTLVDIDNKKLIVITLNCGKPLQEESKIICQKLKLRNKGNIHLILVNKDGDDMSNGMKWTESLVEFKM